MIWSVFSRGLLILICQVLSAEAQTQFQKHSNDDTQDITAEIYGITYNHNGQVTEQAKTGADEVDLEQDSNADVMSKEQGSTMEKNDFEEDNIEGLISLEKGNIANVSPLERNSIANANTFEQYIVDLNNLENVHIYKRRKRMVTKLFGAGRKAIMTLFKGSQASNKLRKGATRVNTHSLFRIFERTGGWKEAKRDFDSVSPSPVYKFYNEGGHVLIGKAGDKIIALTQHGTNGKPEIKLGYDMKFMNPPVELFRYTQ